MPRTSRLLYSLPALALSLLASQASAGTFLGEMRWSSMLQGGTISGLNEQQIDGSASFLFSTDGVSPTGQSRLVVAPLLTFSMTDIELVDTVWDLSNTAALLEYTDGVLQSAAVGSALPGPFGVEAIRMATINDGRGGLTDDFAAFWREPVLPLFPGRFGVASVTAMGSIDGPATVTFTITEVPEPATSGLLLAAGGGMLLRRRRAAAEAASTIRDASVRSADRLDGGPQ